MVKAAGGVRTWRDLLVGLLVAALVLMTAAIGLLLLLLRTSLLDRALPPSAVSGQATVAVHAGPAHAHGSRLGGAPDGSGVVHRFGAGDRYTGRTHPPLGMRPSVVTLAPDPRERPPAATARAARDLSCAVAATSRAPPAWTAV